MPKPFWCRAFCGYSESDVFIFVLSTYLYVAFMGVKAAFYLYGCLFICGHKQRYICSVEVDCTSFDALIWVRGNQHVTEEVTIKWLITTNMRINRSNIMMYYLKCTTNIKHLYAIVIYWNLLKSFTHLLEL